MARFDHSADEFATVDLAAGRDGPSDNLDSSFRSAQADETVTQLRRMGAFASAERICPG